MAEVDGKKAKQTKPKTKKIATDVANSEDKPKTSRKRKTSSAASAAEDEAAKNREYIVYKNKPLVRSGDIIYYGLPTEKYMILYKISGETSLKDGFTLCSDVAVQLQKNGDTPKLIKQAKRDTLYRAIDIGTFWLEDALENY
jgi:hypothetical protein